MLAACGNRLAPYRSKKVQTNKQAINQQNSKMPLSVGRVRQLALPALREYQPYTHTHSGNHRKQYRPHIVCRWNHLVYNPQLLAALTRAVLESAMNIIGSGLLALNGRGSGRLSRSLLDLLAVTTMAEPVPLLTALETL